MPVNRDSMGPQRPPLPVDTRLPEIRATLEQRQCLVVSAPPGSGKTTRIPPALADGGPVLVLQPRRVAARSLARRIAVEQGWRLGEEVGWQVRWEHRFGRRTQLLMATEGILTARLQTDPLLSEFRTVILDEFHERSIHTDLALALLKEALAIREDLRLVVMSATMDCETVADYLGSCPVIRIESRPHPVDIRYEDGVAPATAIRRLLARDGRHLLCFLPGAGEIDALARDLGQLKLPAGVRILPLHGGLSSAQQDAALEPSRDRKLLLATNIAETSLTVEGVTDVIDLGFHKVLRFDPARGIDRLVLERIPADCAEQRAGRAGRTEPGRALRLWDSQLQLRASREPEIRRIDLSAPFLAVYAWGGDPAGLSWFEPPSPDRAAAAEDLLRRLGLLRNRGLTERGRLVQRFPLHPRLACVLAAAGGSPSAARLCAALSEKRAQPPSTAVSGTCDPLVLLDASPGDRRFESVIDELHRLSRRLLGSASAEDSELGLLRAVLAGFADRVARRRAPGSDRLLLCNGHGAQLARQSCVREGEFLVALEVTGARPDVAAEALVTQASLVHREWLEPTGVVRRLSFDPQTESVKAVEETRYGVLVLGERPVPPDPEAAAELLLEELRRRGPSSADLQLLKRAELAGVELDLEVAWRRACHGRIRLPNLDLKRSLSAEDLRRINRLCPVELRAPNGRKLPIQYGSDSVRIAARIQDLFGLKATPQVGRMGEPVLIELLAPNGRPVQVTRDLESFWRSTYGEVRKELRGRYPKHAWPEVPPATLPGQERQYRSKPAQVPPRRRPGSGR